MVDLIIQSYTIKESLTTFCYPSKVEKVLLLGETSKVQTLMDLHFLRPFEYKNHIFRGWSVCMCVCESVCVSVISITKKQITAETSNKVFYDCIIRRCYLKLFIKIGEKLYVQRHTKEF